MQYISVVEYDPAWREKFEREAGLFKNILKGFRSMTPLRNMSLLQMYH